MPKNLGHYFIFLCSLTAPPVLSPPERMSKGLLEKESWVIPRGDGPSGMICPR
jgi:hypothetical protein